MPTRVYTASTAGDVRCKRYPFAVAVPPFPSTVTPHAFDRCSMLTSVKILDGVHTIGSYAFHSCANLVSVEIPYGTRIAAYAFADCPSLVSVVFIKGGATKPLPFRANRTDEEPDESSLESTFSVVGAHAFADCRRLTKMTLPENVVRIDNDAFRGCKALASIELPPRLATLGARAFLGCRSLRTLVIPEAVGAIEQECFHGCSGLTSLTFPPRLVSIGSYAFECCRGLTRITLPDTVARIGEAAFMDCSGITELVLPPHVQSVGRWTFALCAWLAVVRVEGRSSDFHALAFEGCPRLELIVCHEQTPSLEQHRGGARSADLAVLEGIPLADAATQRRIQSLRHWCRQSHRHCAPGMREWVVSVLLVGHRLSASQPQLWLPPEMWYCILGFIQRFVHVPSTLGLGRT